MNFGDLKVGHTVICVNEQGWEDFEKGERYRVVHVGDDSITINGVIVSEEFEDDFVRDPLDQFCVTSLQINDVDGEGNGVGEIQGYAIRNADNDHTTSIWEDSDDPAEQMLFQLIKDGHV